MGRGRVRSIRMQLSRAQRRIRELETQLSSGGAGAGAAEAVSALQARERELSTALSQARNENESLRAELSEARAATEAALAAQSGQADPVPQIARLETELASERSRRVAAEDQLARMREETSSGPFDAATATALEEARGEIEQLRQQLQRERGERDDLEQRYAELKVRLDQQPAVVEAAVPVEVAELQEDQRRLMAAIQQDLEASRKREAELRSTIANLQGAEGGGLTDRVRDLETENLALQSTLDAEHQRNVDLAAKLEVATRVADLIFKMRREGRVPSPEALDAATGQ